MALEFRFPDIGEGIDAGELLEWHVSEGQAVREDDPMAEVQTDKATVTIPCPTTGRVLELRMKVGDMVPVGEVMAVFEPVADGGRADRAPAAAAPPGQPLASPVVRKRAAELGLDLAQVKGSGPGGRIELTDLEPEPGRTAPAERGAPDRPGPGRVEPLRGVRRAIARTMTEAWRTIPHIIDYREADASELLRWRRQLREQADGERMRRALTITPLLVRIAVRALQRHPYVNASIDMDREEITLHGEYNLGIAAATSDGLIVPVLKQADAKSIAELALEALELIESARAGRLQPAQLAGGTFTVNNYGGLGVWLGTPIIRPGEVANLGVGRIQDRVVAIDGQVAVRPIVSLAVSGDHRVLDGHTLGAFASDVVSMIEQGSHLGD